ncbi:hypothetical protein [Pseudomonas palmensis]|uniref:hypothetical protein n=1 Tax=Pseudomonas palmensis TaxID=2815362 RepID=UPI003CF80765
MSNHSVLRSKRSIEMISALVRMGFESVALGKFWKTIHRDYGVGEVSGSKLLLCSGLMKPDTHLGENARHREVSDDQATSYLYP